MKIHLKIFKETEHSTLSEVYVDGAFFCYALEDGYNHPKIWGETRVPHGVYPIEKRKAGKFYNKYNHKWNHKFVPHLTHVTNYNYVLIHVGNRVVNTAGCILVGTTYGKEGADFVIWRSTEKYKKLYKMIDMAFDEGDDVDIIIDRSNSQFENHESITKFDT